jgi:hypothetical protein
MSSFQYTNLTRSAFTTMKKCSIDILYELGVYDDISVGDYKKLKKEQGDTVKDVWFEVFSNVTDPTVDVVFRVGYRVDTEKQIVGLPRDSDLLRFIAEPEKRPTE